MRLIDLVFISAYFLISFIVVEKLAPDWIKKNKDLTQPNLKQFIQYRFPLYCLVPFRALTYKDKYKSVRLLGYITSYITGPVFYLTSYIFIYGGCYLIYHSVTTIYTTLRDI